ncbi:hypothetical protein FIBSPDRAFT_900868 [Athelia psychrophila]|uniref:Uncharacterized protein n=1 Tax=Athelia psychrophila TaxID=1759441 RepID=A0A165XX91_9AGAM|nr:hypothetical protein FIBSPDRAFT_900868 [Fibularhizoctonia sp. CBS 109695]
MAQIWLQICEPSYSFKENAANTTSRARAVAGQSRHSASGRNLTFPDWATPPRAPMHTITGPRDSPTPARECGHGWVFAVWPLGVARHGTGRRVWERRACMGLAGVRGSSEWARDRRVHMGPAGMHGTGEHDGTGGRHGTGRHTWEQLGTRGTGGCVWERRVGKGAAGAHAGASRRVVGERRVCMGWRACDGLVGTRGCVSVWGLTHGLDGWRADTGTHGACRGRLVSVGDADVRLRIRASGRVGTGRHTWERLGTHGTGRRVWERQAHMGAASVHRTGGRAWDWRARWDRRARWDW